MQRRALRRLQNEVSWLKVKMQKQKNGQGPQNLGRPKTNLNVHKIIKNEIKLRALELRTGFSSEKIKSSFSLINLYPNAILQFLKN